MSETVGDFPVRYSSGCYFKNNKNLLFKFFVHEIRCSHMSQKTTNTRSSLSWRKKSWNALSPRAAFVACLKVTFISQLLISWRRVTSFCPPPVFILPHERASSPADDKDWRDRGWPSRQEIKLTPQWYEPLTDKAQDPSKRRCLDFKCLSFGRIGWRENLRVI